MSEVEQMQEGIAEPKGAFTVLVAEDEPVSRAITKALLENANYETVCMDNALKALTYLEGAYSEIDLIILDRVMPLMEGTEMAMTLKADVRFRDKPIIMLSGAGSEREVAEGVKAGVDMYLTKPVEEESLLKALRIIVAKKELK